MFDTRALLTNDQLPFPVERHAVRHIRRFTHDSDVIRAHRELVAVECQLLDGDTARAGQRYVCWLWQCGEVQGIFFRDVDRVFVRVDFYDFDEEWCIAHHRLKFAAMHYEDVTVASTTGFFP